jgi:N-carbamoyl-L-amino-acid hydrolase
MKYRKDALYAAVKTIQYLHDELDELDPALVYTTGKISCHPNIHTIIPDEVKFTLDARHDNPDVLHQVLSVIEKIPQEVAKCGASHQEAWSRKSVTFSKELVDIVERGAMTLGYSARRMFSGPGHDAQYAADILPTAMIFVPSTGGHSHCELEFTPVKACAKGVDVLIQTLLSIDQQMG